MVLTMNMIENSRDFLPTSNCSLVLNDPSAYVAICLTNVWTHTRSQILTVSLTTILSLSLLFEAYDIFLSVIISCPQTHTLST